MVHRLNANKQFMIGNAVLAFAIIFIVVVFVYLSFRLQHNEPDKSSCFTEIYKVSLAKGFAGDSISVYINDSLLFSKQISEDAFTFEVNRFEEQSALIIVDNLTEKSSIFNLSNKGGKVMLIKENDGIKQLAQ